MIARFRRYLARRRQPNPCPLGEYEMMLLASGMTYRNNRLQHNGYRNGI